MESADFERLLIAGQSVVFIGRIRTPFTSRKACPHNVRLARVNGGSAKVEVSEPFRAGLSGLSGHSHVWLLYWMDESPRDVLIQHPRPLGEARGVFSIRSPARPNPIAMASARILALDEAGGTIEVEQLDCRDGTPLLDIKPYIPSVDSVPDADLPAWRD